MPMSVATTVSKVSSVHAATAPAVGNGNGNGSGIVGGGNGQQETVATTNGGGSSSLSESAKTNSSISDLTAAVATTTTIITTNNNTLNAKNPLKASLPSAISAFNGGPNANNNDAANPMKQTLVTIEHKIRNLEKRKTKLESYRAIQATGKDLSSDQNAAVAKFDAVIATLEFARDLSKQMVQFCKDAEKEQKKQARKDVIARAIAETAKIREVLVIQNVLSCFTDEAVRADFLAGENGAVKLDSSDLDALEKFCIDIQTRRPETHDDVPFIQTAQKAAELFSMTVDARPKQYGETTFEKLRNIFAQIQDSGYLDKIYLAPTQVNSEMNVNEDQLITADIELDASSVPTGHNSIEEGLDKLHLVDGLGNGHQESQNSSAGESILQQEQQQLLHGTQQQPLVPQQQAQQQTQQQIQQERATPLQASVQQPNVPASFGVVPPPAPQSGSTTPVHVLYAANQAQGAPIVPPVTGGILPPPPQLVAGAYPRQMMVVYDDVTQVPARGHSTPPPPSASVAQSGSHFGPTTVRAVEQNYFKQHQQPQPHQPQNQQQFMQQMRPLSEVIGSGSFYFLQDSELDSPDVSATNVQQQAQPPQSLQPVAGIIFEQQQPPVPTNGPQQQPQQLNNHVEELQQQAQTIQTQTFTNQSYPPLQQQQQQQQQQAATHGIANNAPSPLYQHQPKQQPLFSPVTAPQLLLQHDQRQQQQQPPMPILARLPPQQQMPPQAIGMQAGDVIGATTHPNVPFAFTADSNAAAVIVNPLSYEQQLQQQLGLKPTVVSNSESEPVQQQQQQLPKLSATDENSNNEWHTRSSSDTNAAATAVLTNVLKTSSSALSTTTTSNSSDAVVTNKWSTEMNALGTPTTPMHLAVTGSNSGSGINQNNNSVRKNDWSSSNSSSRDGGYADAPGRDQDTTPSSNHWNQENGSGNGRRNSGNYQHRRDRGDDRRQDERDRGARGGYRTRNYGGGNNGPQHNGRGGSGGGGTNVYFRNNDPNSSGGSSGGGSGGGGGGSGSAGGGGGSGGGGSGSYYNQNGGGVYANKESRYDSGGNGGNYRGPRNNNQRSGGAGGNAPYVRSLGRNNGGGGGASSNNGSSYINSRQTNRLPISLENKN